MVHIVLDLLIEINKYLQESEILLLRDQINSLKNKLLVNECQEEKSEDPNLVAALTENSKLKYRLSIIKRVSFLLYILVLSNFNY